MKDPLREMFDQLQGWGDALQDTPGFTEVRCYLGVGPNLWVVLTPSVEDGISAPEDRGATHYHCTTYHEGGSLVATRRPVSGRGVPIQLEVNRIVAHALSWYEVPEKLAAGSARILREMKGLNFDYQDN